jgi:hypothetical protein
MAHAAGDRLDRQASRPGRGPGASLDAVLDLEPGDRLSRLQADIETYVTPWATDDPGQPQVTGRIGDGFNLDGKVKATDFVSPDGEKGIDNNLYRAWGCDAPWRGNGNATLDLRANDKMQEGLYTMVLRVSGNQDPMNDSDAIVEIGYSPDKIIKDARGASPRLFYRILKSAHTQAEARIKTAWWRPSRWRSPPAHCLVLRPDRRHQFHQGQDPAYPRFRWIERKRVDWRLP